jgi:hypothetical protein
MATSPNYSWPEPDNTDLVKNGALAIRTLGNAIDTTMATMVPKTIIDAKGDIIAGTAADTAARLAVGTNGQVLKANSATATGLEWAADSAGMTNPMTTTGDTIYSSSGSTPARLAIGSTGQVLTVAAGIPSWATPSGGGATLVGCSLYKLTTNQSIANDTDTAITFNTEEWDTDGFHSTSSNTSRITIPTGKGGKYFIIGTAGTAASAVGVRSISFTVNGGTAIIAGNQVNATTSFSYRGTASGIYELAAADYIEMFVSQTSGGSLDVIAGRNTTRFGVFYLGA